MRSPRMWSVLAGTALAMSACGSDGGSDTAADAPEDETVAVVYESPLGEFLGWSQDVDFDEEAAQAEWAEQEREVQEAIAQCMSGQGFEYIPIDTAAQNAFFEQQYADDIEWGTPEWITTYGYGVSTQRFSQQQVGPDLVGNTYSPVVSDEGPPDPNQDYVNGLGPNEQSAYYEALYGGEDQYPTPIWEEEGREPTDEEMEAYDREFQENYQPTGCEPVAYEEIYNGGLGQDQYEEFDAEFGQALAEMEERMESHPDVIAYRSDVQACVEERGVEYLTEEDAYQYFEEQLDAAGLGWEDEGDPFEGIDTTDFTDEDYNQFWEEFQSQPLAPEKLTALAEIQANEIATAVAFDECGGGWQAEMEALQSVRIQIEEEFLAANAEGLAAFEGVFGN